jgi:diguanylate cyclase (GGDEF)-like protein
MFEGMSREEIIEQFRRTLEADAARRTELEQRIKNLEEEVGRLRPIVGIDALTKALNRCFIGEKLEEEVAFHRRLDLTLSLLFLDLDKFKRVNDDAERGGHQAGDAVLAQLVERLKNTLRRYDSVGRYGGDEFIVILKGVGGEDAVTVAERIRAVVAKTPFEFQKHKIPVTVSVGVAERKHQEMAFSLIGAADQALLRAKRAGGNRVVLDDRT